MYGFTLFYSLVNFIIESAQHADWKNGGCEERMDYVGVGVPPHEGRVHGDVTHLVMHAAIHAGNLEKRNISMNGLVRM